MKRKREESCHYFIASVFLYGVSLLLNCCFICIKKKSVDSVSIRSSFSLIFIRGPYFVLLNM